MQIGSPLLTYAPASRLYRAYAPDAAVPVAEPEPVGGRRSTLRDQARAPARGAQDAEDSTRRTRQATPPEWRSKAHSMPSAVLYAMFDRMGGAADSAWKGMHVNLSV